MKPKIIIHNQISLDGCVTGFEVDMAKFYGLVSQFKEDATLVGSNTALKGIEMFMKDIPKEKKEDMKKPSKSGVLWVLVDSEGKLMNKMHVLRNFEYCRDVLVLVSDKTPKKYIQYLEEREYDYIKTGKIKVNLHEAFNILHDKYKIKVMRSDSGGTLNSVLIKEKLVDEISLLISPVIVGNNNLFFKQDILDNNKLKLISSEKIDDLVWIRYSIDL